MVLPETLRNKAVGSSRHLDVAKVGLDERDTHPANCLTLELLSKYCAWARGRVPTSSEWEWAARGRARGFSHPWGNFAPTPGTVCWDHVGTCVAMGSPLDRSVDGVWDLAGNVFEWTIDDAQRGYLSGGSFMFHYGTATSYVHFPGSSVKGPGGELAMGGRCVWDPED